MHRQFDIRRYVGLPSTRSICSGYTSLEIKIKADWAVVTAHDLIVDLRGLDLFF